MIVHVTGKNMDLGDALRGRIQAEMEAGVEKYFDRSGQAQVFVSPDGSGYRVDCNVNLASGRTIISHGHGGDAHAAFDDALTKIEKRVRRYKRKLRNHKVPGGKASNPGPEETVPLVVLAAPTDDHDEADDDLARPEDFEGIIDSEPQPVVIAESQTAMPTMTVAMAVLELDMRGYPVVLFRNAGSGAASLVYRRPDGNVGWVDLDRAQGTRKGDAQAA